jgi:hypothetical protein
MKHFQDFACLEQPRVTPSRAAGVARDGKNEINGSNEAIGCIIDLGQDGKMGILVKIKNSLYWRIVL